MKRAAMPRYIHLNLIVVICPGVSIIAVFDVKCVCIRRAINAMNCNATDEYSGPHIYLNSSYEEMLAINPSNELGISFKNKPINVNSFLECI